MTGRFSKTSILFMRNLYIRAILIIHLLGDGLISSSLIEIVFDELLAFRFSLLFESRLSGIGFFESNEIVKFSSIFSLFGLETFEKLEKLSFIKKNNANRLL